MSDESLNGKRGGHPMSASSSVFLSPRLQMIADLIPSGLRVADIGTDHGLLAVWLLQHGAAEVVASDLRPGPLQSARRTAERYDVEDRIRFALSDGFCALDPDHLDAAVIAGMGGETIAAIIGGLTEAQRRHILLVLQPQSKERELFQALGGMGYSVTAASAALDAGRRYAAFALRCGDSPCFCDGFGALARSGAEESVPWLRKRRKRLEKEAAALARAGREAEAAERLKESEELQTAETGAFSNK